jgi:hypothetical protein
MLLQITGCHYFNGYIVFPLHFLSPFIYISQLLWIVLQWTWEYRCMFNISISFSLNVYPEVDLLNHMVVVFLILWGIAILFSIADCKFTIPSTVYKSFLFLQSHQHVIFFTFGNSHSRCYLLWIIWMSLVVNDIVCFFTGWSFVYLLWRNVYSGVLPTF